jgi:RES domain-containing protein
MIASSSYLEILNKLIEVIGTDANGLDDPRITAAIQEFRTIAPKAAASAAERAAALSPRPFSGAFWRGVKVKYQNAPLGTDGSRLLSARYHLKGRPALYLANTATTVVAELKLDLERITSTIVPIEVDLCRVLDLSDPSIRQDLRVEQNLLNLEWQLMSDIFEVPAFTQCFGEELREQLFEAIVYDSVREPGAKNLVVFPENLRVGSCIRVRDADQFPGAEPKVLRIDGLLPRVVDCTQ